MKLSRVSRIRDSNVTPESKDSPLNMKVAVLDTLCDHISIIITISDRIRDWMEIHRRRERSTRPRMAVSSHLRKSGVFIIFHCAIVASMRRGSRRHTVPARIFESHTDPRPTRIASPPAPANCCTTFPMDGSILEIGNSKDVTQTEPHRRRSLHQGRAHRLQW